MKSALTIMIIVFGTSITGDVSGSITYEQASKLVDAAWKPIPTSMDVTYCVAIEDNTKTEQDLQKMYEKAYDQMHGSKEDMSEYQLQNRESTVEMNVKQFIKEQQEGGRKKTYRIRYNEYCVRVDRANAWFCSKTTADSNMPFSFSSIEVTNQDGTVERFEYNDESKSATRRKISAKEKQDITKAPVTYFMTIPDYFILRMKMGASPNGQPNGPYEVDSIKINKLCSGTLEGMRIDVSPDESAPEERDRIEINIYAKDVNKLYLRTIMICDKEDYSQVYYYGFLNHVTNQTIPTRICRDFDSQGFPHYVKEMKYDRWGKLNYCESYQILDVHVNASIPKEAFAFNPPENYEIIEIGPDRTSKIIREKGGFEGGIQKFKRAAQNKDITALKELLTHDEWKIRSLSLQTLGYLLEQDPNELEVIASNLVNDTNSEVRNEAEKILQRLNAKETSNQENND